MPPVYTQQQTSGLSDTILGGLAQGASGLGWLIDKIYGGAQDVLPLPPGLESVQNLMGAASDAMLKQGENLAGRGAYTLADTPGGPFMAALTESGADVLTPEVSDLAKAAKPLAGVAMHPKVVKAIGEAFEKTTGKSLRKSYKASSSELPEIAYHTSWKPFEEFDEGMRGATTGAENTNLGMFLMEDYVPHKFSSQGEAPYDPDFNPSDAAYALFPQGEDSVLDLNRLDKEIRELFRREEFSGMDLMDYHEEGGNLPYDPSRLQEVAQNLAQEEGFDSDFARILSEFPDYLAQTMLYDPSRGGPVYDLSRSFMRSDVADPNASLRGLGYDLIRLKDQVDASMVYSPEGRPPDEVTQLIALNPEIVEPLSWLLLSDTSNIPMDPNAGLAGAILGRFLREKVDVGDFRGFSPYTQDPEIIRSIFGPYADMDVLGLRNLPLEPPTPLLDAGGIPEIDPELEALINKFAGETEF